MKVYQGPRLTLSSRRLASAGSRMLHSGVFISRIPFLSCVRSPDTQQCLDRNQLEAVCVLGGLFSHIPVMLFFVLTIPNSVQAGGQNELIVVCVLGMGVFAFLISILSFYFI